MMGTIEQMISKVEIVDGNFVVYSWKECDKKYHECGREYKTLNRLKKAVVDKYLAHKDSEFKLGSSFNEHPELFENLVANEICDNLYKTILKKVMKRK